TRASSANSNTWLLASIQVENEVVMWNGARKSIPAPIFGKVVRNLNKINLREHKQMLTQGISMWLAALQEVGKREEMEDDDGGG
ncbi:hypothetical protein PV327_002089, partial [Microctonus hyperodae]